MIRISIAKALDSPKLKTTVPRTNRCSLTIASWIDVLSCSFILSNSSMRQTPLSARTSAPPSSVHSLVSGSLCTLAVSPTADAPLPVEYTARGAVASAYLSICDLAVPGSPRMRTGENSGSTFGGD